MDYIKRAIYGLDPQEQKRKCSSLIRQNQRELDKMINSITGTEQKTKNMIRAAAKRNDMKSARFLAKEIYNSKKAKERLHKSKAQLNSVNLQVNEAFAIRKLEGSMKTSTGLMKEVNSLIRMPELMGTMTQLSQELMRVSSLYFTCLFARLLTLNCACSLESLMKWSRIL
jgi:charged multivesicular body protein 3